MLTHIAKVKELLEAATAELDTMLKKCSPMEYALLSQWAEFVKHNSARAQVLEQVFLAEKEFDRGDDDRGGEPVASKTHH